MKGKLEDVELPEKKVDIIISEVSLRGAVNGSTRSATLTNHSGWATSSCTSRCLTPSSSPGISTS